MVPVRSKGLWSEALAMPDSPDAKQLGSAPGELDPLVPRRLHDSYCEIMLPYGSNPELLENYTNASGVIRTGLLMEHLDSLARSIAYKHMLGPDVSALPKNAGFYMVTASVDRLGMLASLYPVRDMRLSGQVIHTGRSSLEVAVRVEALEKDGKEKTIMLAHSYCLPGRFCMVCRDARTHGSALVNPLSLETAEDHILYTIGEVHKKKRQSRAVRSLNHVPPTSSEAEALHSLYLCTGRARWASHVAGYLMRLAYELGFANSCLFTRDHVTFLSFDGISFARPVPLGSVLWLTSYIVHSSSSESYPALVHVCVHADVVNLETGTEQRMNDFRFTRCRESGPPLSRMVVPKTYGEVMQWLVGGRAVEMGSEVRKLRKGP
ncbi:Thioesterase/thiol ester dehydrase-isomerase [Pilatotrama ljubarskyi]|nr:Thioesterase/thiol ester dehydrase-isomerase [Pilatotrama ljubarskyi]